MASAGGAEESDWSGTWKALKNSAPATLPPPQPMKAAFHQCQARLLEGLLVHYPRIVYVVYCLWRKMLIRGWFPLGRESAEKIGPSLSWSGRSASMLLQNPQPLGVLGDLNKFTSQFLPPSFLKRRIPLTVPNLDAVVEGEEMVSGGTEFRHTVSVAVGTFVVGLTRSNDLDVARILVEELGLDLGATNWFYATGQGHKTGNQTILHLTLRLPMDPSHCRLAPFLLKRYGTKVNVNAPDQNRLTLLHVAADGGFTEVASLLVDSLAADTNVRDTFGWTPLHTATQRSQPNGGKGMCCALLRKGRGNNDRDLVVDAVTFDGYTALHYAASSGHIDFVRCLVFEHGADASIKARGVTALEQAAAFGFKEIVAVLTDHTTQE